MNVKGLDFVVGDIHGMYSNLEEKLEEIGFNKETDRLFSVGDLVDRGPESAQALEYLKKDWFCPLRGNHDEFILRSYYKEDGFNNNRWADELHGGSWWFDLSDSDQKDFAEAMSEVPLAMELKTNKGLVGFVHANVPFSMDWNKIKHLIETDEEIQHYIQWNRDRAYGEKEEDVDGVYKMYMGHTVFPEVTNKGNVVFVDTGSGYENATNPKYIRKNPRLVLVQIS
jgi:serine/threonine protein phosphatase 1